MECRKKQNPLFGNKGSIYPEKRAKLQVAYIDARDIIQYPNQIALTTDQIDQTNLDQDQTEIFQ